METLDAILEEIRLLTLSLREAERRLNEAKQRLLRAVRAMPEEHRLYAFPLREVDISIRRRVTKTVKDADMLRRLLGSQWEDVLVPDPSLVYDALVQHPMLLASALSTGALSLTETEYVSVTTSQKGATVEVGEGEAADATAHLPVS